MPGPPKTPVAVLKMRGSWRARGREDAAATSKELCGAPPSYLCSEAKTEWRRIVKCLGAIKLGSAADRHALAGYCDAVAWFARVTRERNEIAAACYEDSDGEHTKRIIAVHARALDALIRTAREFGLTPSARAGLKPEHETKDTKAAKERFFSDTGT